MSRLYRLLRRPALILVALAGLLVGSAAYLFALPMYEVNVSYYDESDQLVAQRGITCNGAHWGWGDNTLAQPGTIYEEKHVCTESLPPYHWQCWWWQDEDGHRYMISCQSW